MGLLPPVAVAVPESVMKASREFVAAARLGTEFTRSFSSRISRCHPSRVVLEYCCGAISFGSAMAVAASVSPHAAMKKPVLMRRAITKSAIPCVGGIPRGEENETPAHRGARSQTTKVYRQRQKAPQEPVQSTDTEPPRHPDNGRCTAGEGLIHARRQQLPTQRSLSAD